MGNQSIKGDFISIKGARQHNLKNCDIDIPKNSLVVITGKSGSGKSSLAYDTIYIEGQRRYIESLSSYVRQFLTQHVKPDLDSITGLSPAIAIDQKTTGRNPRSTVATITEIYDYLRVMFARVGTVYSPATNLPITSQTTSTMISVVNSLPVGTKIRLCSPVIRGEKGRHLKDLTNIKAQGYQRVKINDKIADIDDIISKDGLEANKAHTIEVVVDRVVISDESPKRVADSIETCAKLSGGMLYVDVVELPPEFTEIDLPHGYKAISGGKMSFSEKFSCPESGFTLEEVEPRLFSFNSPFGACKSCSGLGTELSFNTDLIVPDTRISLKNGAIKPWHHHNWRYYLSVLSDLAKHYKFSLDVPFSQLEDSVKDVLFFGTKGEEVEFSYDDGYRVIKTKKAFDGIIRDLERGSFASDDILEGEDAIAEKYQNLSPCSACSGFRLRPEALSVKIDDMHIGHICSMSIDKCDLWFSELSNRLSPTQLEIAHLLIKEIRARLGFLRDVGLNYLTLRRDSSTLSGGEAQRIRLASQIGSGLCGVIYVLDEPSIGLHQSDNHRLIATLKKLRDLGNSVIVVEHDEETMMEADYLIDVGPDAGVHGGRIIAHGTVKEVMENPNSITGAYLSGKDGIPVPKARRRHTKGSGLKIVNARGNNLKNVNVTIPLGQFVAITGISGGGKSTLILDTLYKGLSNKINGSAFKPSPHDEIVNFDDVNKIIKIDQSAIGRTPRSNPATYTAVFSQIRDWFAALPEAKARGYKSGRFSFNTKGGRCENCQGDGLLKIEMHFLPDVYVECDVCKGARYNKETLEIKYRDKSIADVLHMTVEEAMRFFSNIVTIKDKMKALYSVGLGYMKIGQSATTLSGGEAQRIKLAKELCKKATGDTLYILDEPTTGLHSADIKHLLEVLHTLVDYGNTAIVIEHNLDVIKTADYVIDIGPVGGDAGGYVVAEGTPEDVAENPSSVTGKYIKEALERAKILEANSKS